MTGLIPTPAPPPMAPSRVLVGSFTTRAHRVSGRMYVLDERTVMLTQFYFDGNAPGMYAYINGARNEVDHLGSTCTNWAENF